MSDVGKDAASADGAAEHPIESDARRLTGDDLVIDPESSADGSPIRPAEGSVDSPPGPGLPESLVWMGGMLGLQVIGGVIGFALIVVLYLIDTGALGRANDDPSPITGETLKVIQREYVGTLFGVIQTVTVLGAATAVFFRLGRDRRRRLPLTPIPWRHVALILAAMLPLVVVSMQLNLCADWVWEQVTERFPSLKPFDDVSSMAAVEKLARRTSFLWLLFMVAVAPAVAEELVFRGAIGRGLIARWGIPGGVLLTSLLFAAMHVHPPQVVALIPLSIFIHVAYIATRSFWAPVSVHFLNNGLAVVALTVILGLPESVKQPDSPPVSALMLLSSGFCAAMLTVTLWKSRVQFIDWDGREWTPGYPAVEWPPEDLPLHARCRPTDLRDWAPAAVGLGVFIVAAIVAGVLSEAGWQV
jgi:hypothetical protein